MTAADIEAIVKPKPFFFCEANRFSCQNFKHICIDGAQAMIGFKETLVTLIKNE